MSRAGARDVDDDGAPAAPRLVICDYPEAVGRAAAELIAERLAADPELRLMVPSGRTPLPMYAELRRMAAAGGLRSRSATLLQLDECAGLGPSDRSSYAAYLARQLAGIEFGARHTIDGEAPDGDAEIRRHERVVEAAPVDLVVLGLGPNGHVAFNEPGSASDSGARVVELTEESRAALEEKLERTGEPPTHGLTIGMRTLLAAGEVVLLVTGRHKRDLLERALRGPVTPDFPASLLRDHPRLTVIADREAPARLAAEQEAAAAG